MEKLLVTVSGGRTSGYMAVKLFQEYSHKYDMTFVYSNTGQEHEKTLEFVRNIEKHFSIPIIWIEAVVDLRPNKGTDYIVVSFETASRKGEPFEEVIRKYGLPTQGFMHCTRELKLQPMNKFRNSRGIKVTALGIRADEPNRYKSREEVFYPLVDLFKTSKPEILRWWGEQEFDLGIPDYLGNCTWCYKKSDRKLAILATDHKEVFDFPKRMEEKYPDDSRKIFRGYRTTQEVIDNTNIDLFNFDMCAEECGTVII